MKIERITIALDEHEMIVLQKRAQSEFRPVKDQARYLLLNALGLVLPSVHQPNNNNAGTTTPQPEAVLA